MKTLILGLLLFLAPHSVRIVAENWRLQMRERLGEMAYKGLYALASLVGLVLVVKGYAEARLEPVIVWTAPLGVRHLTTLLMLPAMVLVVSAYVPGNALKARLGHPMVLGVKVWALAHLISNGHLAAIVLFGSLLVWSVLSFRAARQRDRREELTLAEVTPVARPVRSHTLLSVVLGVSVWAAMVAVGHAWLIGVSPLGL